MKKLAATLGIIAFLATVGVSINWVQNARSARTATQKLAAAEASSQEYQFASKMREDTENLAVSNEELEIENHETEVQIAELEGRSPAAANKKLAIARAKLAADKSMVTISSTFHSDGVPSSVETAIEDSRADLAKALDGKSIDERLYFVTVILWLAAIFAAQMTRGKTRELVAGNL